MPSANKHAREQDRNVRKPANPSARAAIVSVMTAVTRAVTDFKGEKEQDTICMRSPKLLYVDD